jgi:ATP-binding cassette subfamily B protein/subfamily B ATP-binding cassette protein MsbA
VIKVFTILWPHLGRHRRLLIIAAAAMFGEVVTALLAPWPLKFVFDSILFVRDASGHRQLRTRLDASSVRDLVLVSAAALAIALLDALFTYFDGWITARTAQRAISALRRALFAHLQRLSVSFHHALETRVGDLLSRLSGDVQALQDLASAGASNLITNTLTLSAMGAVLLALNVRLGLLVCATTIPLFFLTRSTTLKMRVALRAARKQEGHISAMLQESLSSVRLVQAYGREEHEDERLAVESSKSLDASLEAAELQSRLNPSITVVSALSMVAVTAYGALLAIRGAISPGTLLIFLGYMRSIQTPIRQLAKLSYQIGKASTAAERLREVFQKIPAISEKAGAGELVATRGTVLVENVTFGYLPGRAVLRNVTLQAAAREVIAIVGATGAGKSSLVSLIPRFYDPWEGTVRIDGIDVRECTLRSVRAQVALVFQESLIFRASIRENIAYGRAGATDEEIEAAGEAAGLGTIVRKFEHGYDTVVSERGTSLSGGQKQCVGIARAILKNAPILILDEPTSSLDAETEKIVLAGLKRLMSGRTVFLIAHRLSTVIAADRIAVIDAGELREFDTPSALLARDDGIFSRLARIQALAMDVAR